MDNSPPISMSISSVSNANSLYQTYQSSNPAGTSQFLQNLSSLGTALQSGDTSSAQSALTTLQQSLPTSAQNSNQPFGNNSQANSAYQNLVSDVQSGNLTSAQNDLSQLQTHLKSGHAHGGHHHGGKPATPPPTDDSTATTSTTNDSDSTSGNFINVTV